MRVYHRTRFGAISYRPRILGIFLIAGVLLPTLVAGMWQAFIGLAVAGVVLLAFLRVSHRQHTETVNCVWCRYDSAQAIQSEARQERKAQTAAKRAEILTQGDGGWPITVIGAVVPTMPLVAGIIGHQPWVYGPAAVLLAGWWMYRASRTPAQVAATTAPTTLPRSWSGSGATRATTHLRRDATS